MFALHLQMIRASQTLKTQDICGFSERLWRIQILWDQRGSGC